MGAARSDRIQSELVRLGHRGLGVRDFSLRAARALGRVVEFDGVCVLTLDPATLLPTGEFVENGLPVETTPRLTEIELGEADYNKFTALARAERPAASLSEVTRGELDLSVRHRELKRPNGFGDELRAALVGDGGTWGAITLLRESGRPDFAERDVRLVSSVARHFAEGLQRASMFGPEADDARAGDASAPGFLVLEADFSIAMADRAAEAWLGQLRDDGPAGHGLPPAISSVANRARVAAGGGGESATARVRTTTGRWLLVRGSMLGEGPGARIAVALEAARSAELAPLIAEAYGLTARERLVTQLVAQGFSTAQIAQRLHLSAYTVQDHLKAIFEKVGVSSRGELVARLFFGHYLPRLTP
jgi:DNA-binding CsgD family transcriptional regulator